MIKAIFFDIDGTLVSFKTHKISEKSLEALYKAKEKGIKLFIATGRHKSETHCFEGFPFDGYVTLNGQYCYNPEKVIYKNSIVPEDVKTFVALLNTTQMPSVFMEKEEVYLTRMTRVVEDMLKIVKVNKLKMDNPDRALDKEIFQFIAFKPIGEEKELMEMLPNCDFTRWHPEFIDIVPKKGSKKVGIQKMLNEYGISPEEIMAIGDGGNDIPMLELAKVGVAMGNASDEVKSYADYVTTSVDEEGVYHALKQFDLI